MQFVKFDKERGMKYLHGSEPTSLVASNKRMIRGRRCKVQSVIKMQSRIKRNEEELPGGDPTSLVAIS